MFSSRFDVLITKIDTPATLCSKMLPNRFSQHLFLLVGSDFDTPPLIRSKLFPLSIIFRWKLCLWSKPDDEKNYTPPAIESKSHAKIDAFLTKFVHPQIDTPLAIIYKALLKNFYQLILWNWWSLFVYHNSWKIQAQTKISVFENIIFFCQNHFHICESGVSAEQPSLFLVARGVRGSIVFRSFSWIVGFFLFARNYGV